MKVILFNAVSLDGFIATLSGDSGWAIDDEEFTSLFHKMGCVLVGRKTYEQYKGEIFPLSGGVNFVYSQQPQKWASETTSELYFVSGTPQEVLDKIKRQGYDKVMLGGGSETNAAFAQAGLIDEIILDVHPLVLGEGMRLLGDFTKQLKCKLISSHSSPKGFVQLHYRIS